jgi:hypothetical protein
MNCSSCGTQIPAGATNCPTCGAAVPHYYSYSGTASSEPTIPAQPYAAPQQTPSTAYGSQPYGGPPQPPPPYGTPPPPPPYYPYRPPQQIPQGPQGPPPPVRRRGSRAGLIVGLVLLVLVLVAGGIFVAVSRLGRGSPSSTTSTTPTRVNATTTPAVTSQGNPYTHSGKLAFSDALGDNSGGHRWDENGKNCAFTGGTYHAIAPNASFSDYCIAQSTDFNDFVFEAQVGLIKGNAGGIIFRVTSTNPTNEYYSFYIGQDGSYELDKADGSRLTSGTNPAINAGLGKTNVIAVAAKGSSFKLYVNHQPIDTVTDTTYSHGHIGLIAVVYAKGGQPTEVEFSNVKVWAL